ncbi:MAG: DUF445 domain-containing protein [Candidatus Eremiobacteraeota bacterium]|nr:DUF445 domain-containing protein [Candidatus Eremiobacteraeota bacterium]
METRWKSGADVAKLASLQRMQGIALALLLTMVALLAVTSVNLAAHPWTAWLKAFAEAAVVGAVADWFAVVALFRHPLGMPISHTAIIPNNKDRIGESLGRFVEENFLTPENVIQRLARVNIAKVGGTWLAEPANSDRAAGGICAMVPRLLTMIQDEDVARFLTRTLLGELEKVNLSPVAGEVLELVTSGEQYQALFDDALKGIERLITTNQTLILEKFGEASKYTPGFVDQYIVDRFVAGIVRLLQEVIADPQHPLRMQFADSIRKLIEKLKTSPEMNERGAAIKRQIIEHLRTKPYYAALWNDIKKRILADVAADQSRLRETASSLLNALGSGLAKDQVMQHKLNEWLLGALQTLMLAHRHQISLLITDVVKSWDARDVSEKIELEIGKDLQFIRLNGTLVGGCVGVLLHLLGMLFS